MGAKSTSRAVNTLCVILYGAYLALHSAPNPQNGHHQRELASVRGPFLPGPLKTVKDRYEL